MSAGSLARQRRAARLAAVQALYQMEVSGASPASAIQDYYNGQLPRDDSGEIDSDSDGEHFRLIVELAVSRQDEIDRAIARRLSEGWRLERIDSVARAILRAAVVELQARADIPTAVVIDEYVEVAKAFFEGPEPAFINATLDSVAKDARS